MAELGGQAVRRLLFLGATSRGGLSGSIDRLCTIELLNDIRPLPRARIHDNIERSAIDYLLY